MRKKRDKTKTALNRLLKLIHKEIYRREDKFCISIHSPHDATIRAVPLYALEGMLFDIKKELDLL